MNNLLEVKDLKTYFYTDDGVVKAVDGVELFSKSRKNHRYSRRIRLR